MPGTAFDVSAALRDALCRGMVSRLPRRPTGGPGRLYAPWVASVRASAVLPSHPCPRESWDPPPPTCYIRGPHVALRSRAMIFVLSHHGHTLGTLCYSLAPSPLGATADSRVPPVNSAPLYAAPPSRCLAATGHPLPSCYNQPCLTAQRRPRPPPPLPPTLVEATPYDGSRSPCSLMDIAESDDADRLLRYPDVLKDDAPEVIDEAVRAPDPALSDLCDALRWTAADGSIQAITAVTGAWTPRGVLLTATVTVATVPSEVKVIEHVPVALAQGGPLLEYVSKDPDALTAALVTRWSLRHAPISAPRLCHLVFRGLYMAREKAPPIDADVAPESQSQKVSYKLHKPISQFLPPPPQADMGPPSDLQGGGGFLGTAQ